MRTRKGKWKPSLLALVLPGAWALLGRSGSSTVPAPPVPVDHTVWAVRPQRSHALHAVAKGAGTNLVAVGDLGTILTSVDGITWTPQPTVTASTLYGVTYNGAKFVAVGGVEPAGSCAPS